MAEVATRLDRQTFLSLGQTGSWEDGSGENPSWISSHATTRYISNKRIVNGLTYGRKFKQIVAQAHIHDLGLATLRRDGFKLRSIIR